MPASPSSSSPDDLEPPQAVLRILVDHLAAMVAYWDADQRCRFANRAYEKWFGVDPRSMIGMHMRELLGPLYALNLPHIEGALRGEPQEFERDIPDPAGGQARHSLAQYFPDIVDGRVRGFCVLVTDISRLKAAERSLLEVERRFQATARLASLATLAAGIAHEINNPLAAVLAHTEVALESVAEGAPTLDLLAEDLVAARDGARRVRAVVHSMNLLARGDPLEPETVDVNATLERSVGVVSSSIRHRARVVYELESGAYVEANAPQLAQVLVNVLTNAVQALPEASGHVGEIRVSTRRVAGRLVIEVADNGCGIPETLLARVFEPFFTTKPIGVGIGLGLSLSSAIVSGFGGTISVTSEMGRGSVFRIDLPAAAPPAVDRREAPGAPSEALQQPARHPGARPRVLVIDDEPAVTKTLSRLLSRDCEVVVANHGRDAIPLLVDARLPAFDLILCDLMMPEPSGETIYADVTKQRPDLASRFVFMTGGASTQRGRHFLATVRAPVLEKPFDLSLLRALIRPRAGES